MFIEQITKKHLAKKVFLKKQKSLVLKFRKHAGKPKNQRGKN